MATETSNLTVEKEGATEEPGESQAAQDEVQEQQPPAQEGTAQEPEQAGEAICECQRAPRCRGVILLRSQTLLYPGESLATRDYKGKLETAAIRNSCKYIAVNMQRPIIYIHIFTHLLIFHYDLNWTTILPSLSLSLSLSLSFSLSLSHTHTHTHTLILSLSPVCPHF